LTARGVQHPQPSLVFIHGAGSSSDFWHEQRAAFAHAHYLDLPGHLGRVQSPKSKVQGRSEATLDFGLWTLDSLIEEYAAWVARYVEEEELEGVILDGHSMGGAVALTLALRRPVWLRGIVLTGTGARLRVSPALLELLRTDYPSAIDFIIEHSFVQSSGPLTYAQRVRREGTRRQMLRTPQAVTLADYGACDRFDVMPRLGEIAVPALCIVGADDSMTPPKYSHYLQERIKGARLEIVEGGGHMLPLEQPEEYNRILSRFVAGA
jgi:pimeloyl-ACP methyl ester carboxylesterase